MVLKSRKLGKYPQTYFYFFILVYISYYVISINAVKGGEGGNVRVSAGRTHLKTSNIHRNDNFNLDKTDGKAKQARLEKPRIKKDKPKQISDVDIVGYGEDCSTEGPFCNRDQHLICDLEEETCTCDKSGGYVYVESLDFSVHVCVPSISSSSEEIHEVEPLPFEIDKPVVNTPEPVKSSKVKQVKKDKQDIDVVGYGEDCSNDGGPFCSKSLHLTCDPNEEVCVCDLVGGYMHIDMLPEAGDFYRQMIREMKGLGETAPVEDICVSVEDSKAYAMKQVDAMIGSRNPEKDMDLAVNDAQLEVTAGGVDGANKIADVFKEYIALSEKYDDGTEDEDNHHKKRLEPFKMNRDKHHNFRTLSIPELIVEEILKYGRDIWKDADLLKPILQKFLTKFYDNWHQNNLSKEICNFIFNIDQDEIPTPQEYVIMLLSKRMRALMVPTAFSKLTSKLDCIWKEDLSKMGFNKVTFDLDFQILDGNGDGCVSYSEFEVIVQDVCNADWLDLTMTMMGMLDENTKFDPSPEEMFARRLTQYTRLNSNWEIVDKDGDGFISSLELHSDLVSSGLTKEDDLKNTAELLVQMDYNKDKMISVHEAVITIALSNLEKDYQFDWLESLYELYETDEEEVKEILDLLMDISLDGVEEMKEEVNMWGELRLFYLFDKDRNGVLDEVEFRLLMEVLRKYVVYDLMDEVLTAIDIDGDKKMTLFEYDAVYKVVPEDVKVESKSFLSEYLNVDGAEDDDEEEGEGSSWMELSSGVGKVNDTLITRLLFEAIDANKDGLVTKQDLYKMMGSINEAKSDSEFEKEFSELDLNKDGKLNSKDSAEFGDDFNLDLETYKEYSKAVEDSTTAHSLRFLLMDSNFDGSISKEEFLSGKKTLLSSEEERVRNWLDSYFGEVETEMDEGGAETFREFDEDRDGFVTELEFTKTLLKLFEGNPDIRSYLSLTEDLASYFKKLDLNRDNKVNFNEFSLVLLRTNKRINES